MRSGIHGDDHGRHRYAGGRTMSTRRMHPTAIVHGKAELAEGVTVGAYSIIGEHVRIGQGSRIDAHVVIEGWTVSGEDCQILSLVSRVGNLHHRHYQGDTTLVLTGMQCILR